MAEELKREHHLVALKTSLGRTGRTWLVRMELETHASMMPVIVASWELSTDALGLPKYFEPDTVLQFQLPSDLLGGIAHQIDKLDLAPRQPVWLHLVKPYGYLGMVPWEDLLVPRLGRPVLRLPDFLEPARERRDTLDVAICCSVPLSEPSFSISDLLGRIATAILGNSLRPRTQLHVFPDAGSFDALRQTFGAESRVAVHDPANARQYEEPDTTEVSPTFVRTVASPWLKWMRDAMQGRSLDTVHFACHGYFSEEQSSITVAESPNRDRQTAIFLGVSETSAFLTQTGAWSLVCTAPPNNYSDTGLRYFVDSIAQVRPGPALFHDARRDPGFEALGDAYRFLFAPTPAEAVAGPIFMYCQPALVANQLALREAGSSAAGIVDLNDELFASAEGQHEHDEPTHPGSATGIPSSESEAGRVPNWVASAQRYIEGQVQEVQRREASGARTRSERSHKNSASVVETLVDVQNIVRGFARSAKLSSKS